MTRCSSWMPEVYAMWCTVLAPVTLLFFVVPMAVVGQVYVASSMVFVFVSMWTLGQTFAAWNKGFGTAAVFGSGTPSVQSAKIAYLIPAFLNNEAGILDDTISAFCSLNYRGDILVLVVFNSKGDLSETESVLMAKWNGVVRGQSGNIRITVVKNDYSTSKAENVNFGLSLIPVGVDYTAIMDADHHPSPESASVAVKVMLSKGYHVLQGACTIRNQENFLSKMVSVEFEQMYCVAHSGRFQVFDLGLFLGSNGYWKTSVLREIGMDKSMLTEDIDSSIRALLAGFRVGWSSDVVSSELSPLSRSVLQKQRLRWTQGWTEVSFKHVWKCVKCSHISLRQKLGIIHVLGWREFLPYVTLLPIWSAVAAAVRLGTVEFVSGWIAVVGIVLVVFGFARVIAAYALCRGVIGSNTKAFLLFSVWGIVFDVYLGFIQVCGHWRCLRNANQWVATVRE